MGKSYERIDGKVRTFIEAQHIFFTATAPLDGNGTVNISPKGLSGSFAVLDERTIAYLDFPFMTYDQDRTLHSSRFARDDDESLDTYFQKKEHIATSIDGLPGLPLPLPPLPRTE
ncbi:MAG: hypothetical protein IJH84_27535 [Saccharopolyspora sp.]|uniref:pyridoxamine 5'-phosphate oxidase family protein n=1 Tax=Saccharopolyspora sp. TaxID=33915 RepID=UPI0025D72C66|nr:pyridoxamine 5'-phosphate oxidase family protein [Saccharopolyspora sp.]MBQ6644753.1 hypothetical protein [Saccharopolyspora sp.]